MTEEEIEEEGEEIEFEMNEEEIDEWINELTKLKEEKSSINLIIDDTNSLKINFNDEPIEEEEEDSEDDEEDIINI